jgi:hypothetical protein
MDRMQHFKIFHDNNNKPHQHPDGVVIFNKHHLHSIGIVNILQQNQRMFEDLIVQLTFILMNFRATPWTELKPTSPSTVTAKPNPTPNEPPKDLSTNTRTQDALSKWTQNQFKETSKDIDGKQKTISPQFLIKT